LNQQRTRLLGTTPQIPQICDGPGIAGLVSVVIPTYNRAYILAASIDSVLAQTYAHHEIIVVDDGSRDDTRAVVEKYGSRVRYIHQENAGLATARNTGMAAARGEFIAFQDSDDIWLPHKLEMQTALMRQYPQLALVWSDMTSIDAAGNVVNERHLRTGYSAYEKIDLAQEMPDEGTLGDLLPQAPEPVRAAPYRIGDIFSAMTLGNIVHPPTVLLRRRHLQLSGGLDLTFSFSCEDYEFFWRVSRHGAAALIDAPTMLYRIDVADQLTRPERQLDVARGYVIALDRHLSAHRERIALPRRVLRTHLAESYSWVSKEELVSEYGKRRRAMHYLLRSIRQDPLQRELLPLLVASFTPRSWFDSLRSVKRYVRGFVPAALLLMLAGEDSPLLFLLSNSVDFL
jgi:glycosyltransferase involved in cell wall biosynthesis